MSSLNTQVIAARLRVAKNFMLLISAGVDSSTACEIVKKHVNLTFSEIRFTDDKVVVCYKTCSSIRSIDFLIAA